TRRPTVDAVLLRLCATCLCYAVVLRLCATPLCYAFVLRRRATPLCYAVVLRLCATPSCYAFVLRLCATPSVLAQVPIEFPFADLPDILLPLLALGIEVALVDVIAQRLAHHGVLLEVVQRLVQVARQVVDTEATPLPVRHPRDVLVDGLPGVDLLLHTVYPGGQLHREVEIGVRRRVRHTVLAARRLAA